MQADGLQGQGHWDFSFHTKKARLVAFCARFSFLQQPGRQIEAAWHENEFRAWGKKKRMFHPWWLFRLPSAGTARGHAKEQQCRENLRAGWGEIAPLLTPSA